MPFSAYGNWGLLSEVINIGSRSEATLTYITYAGTKIPLELEHIITPIGEHVARQRVPWAGKDWSLKEANQNTISKTGNAPMLKISGNKQHWIKAAFKDYRSSSWLYSVKHGYWIAPDKIDEFMEFLVAESGKDECLARPPHTTTHTAP